MVSFEKEALRGIEPPHFDLTDEARRRIAESLGAVRLADWRNALDGKGFE
jgi:hypothetical protein